MGTEQPNRRGRLSLLLIAAMALAPIAAAWALYHFWRPTAFTNYGQLLPPAPIGEVAAGQPDGGSFAVSELRGKWVILTVDAGACDEFCRHKLYQMRQVRLTQGKDRERIELAWLIDDDTRPASELVAEYQGTRIVPARGSPMLSRLPAEACVRDHIYIVDPLGNVMMRYPREADASKMRKDVTRLLKVSGVG